MPVKLKSLSDEENRKYRNRMRKLNYSKRNFGIGFERIKYSEKEELMILNNPYSSDVELAKKLRASVQAIQVKRWRLKKEFNRKDTDDKEIKICTKCGLYPKVSWHGSHCRYCCNEGARKRYSLHKEKMNEKNREYHRTHKQQRSRYFREARKKFIVKERARNDVKRAISSGKLKRLPCEKCGSEKTHAHHEDYNKPLDVHWLCIKHHSELHRRFPTPEELAPQEERE